MPNSKKVLYSKTLLQRSGAALVSGLFFYTNVLSVHSAEKNFWAERRRFAQESPRSPLSKDQDQLFAQLPRVGQVSFGMSPGVLLGGSSSFSLAETPPEAPRLSANSTAVLPWISTLLPHGSIREIHLAKKANAPIVIHIQDAHGIEEAQKNVAAMLQGLGEKHGVSLVGLEGASGGIHLAPYRDWPSAAVTRDIADTFLKEGKIGGAEFLGLTASRPLFLWGVEDTGLYLDNIKAFRDSFKEKPIMQKVLADLKAVIGPLKQTLYSKKLLEFDKHFQNYQGQKEGLATYVRYLTSVPLDENSRFPNLSLLLKALAAEERLDFNKVERERLELVQILAKRLPQDRLNLLVERSFQYRAGQIGYGDYHRFMQSLCRDNKIALDPFPQLKDYIAYVLRADKINRNVLLDELTRLEQDAQNRLAVTPEQKRLVAVSRRLALLDKLFVHAMTPQDWAEYQGERQDILRIVSDISALGGRATVALPSQILRPFEDFCRVAIERNRAFIDHLTQQMREQKVSAAVLVAGGFHSDGLAQLLRRRDLSYVVVTPKITEIPKENNYLDVFARDPMPLEKLFSGEKIFLKTALGLSDRPIPAFGGDGNGLKREILTAQIPLQIFSGRENLEEIERVAKERVTQADLAMGLTVAGNDSDSVQLAVDVNNDGTPDLVRTATSPGNQRVVEKALSSVLVTEKIGDAVLLTGRARPTSNERFFHQARALLADLSHLVTRVWAPLRARLAKDLHWEDRFLRRAGIVQLSLMVFGVVLFGPHLWVFAILTPASLVFSVLHLPGIARRYNQLRAIRLVQGPLQILTWWASQLISLFAGVLFLQVAQILPQRAERLHARFNAWAGTRGALRFFNLFGFRLAVGAATWTILEPQTTSVSLAIPLVAGDDVLRDLGLSYDRFQKLVRAQESFERALIHDEPLAAQHIHSLRTQQRFSVTVLGMTKRLRDQGENNPLGKALLFAIDQYYGDLLGKPIAEWAGDSVSPQSRREPVYGSWGYVRSNGENSRDIFTTQALPPPPKTSAEILVDRMKQTPSLIRIHNSFVGFISFDDVIDYLGGPAQATVTSYDGFKALTRMVERAFSTREAILFNEEAGSDLELMAAVRQVAGDLSAEVSVLWSHPFTEERQLVGHRVPKSGADRLVFGQGELLRSIQNAQRELDDARADDRIPQKHVLFIKNVEAMDPEVRTQLQELLRIGELSHPELGKVILPENFQIMMTKRSDANLEDDSFYDRVLVKRVRSLIGPRPTVFAPFRRGRLLKQGGLLFLTIDHSGPRIPLDPSTFSGLMDKVKNGENELSEDIRDEIYLKTGLVLDSDTLRMLAAMEETVQSGRTLLRIEGPTGVGKTFTARGYARLRGSSFLANPASEGTDLADWIGGFEQDQNGLFRFNGETTVKERLEEGGVVALSELNTLLDQNEKVSPAWWLLQIAETKPEADGTKIIRLTEVPVPEGQSVPVIRIHPKALIVVDTNPEGEYAARGTFPDLFKEEVPVLKLDPFIIGEVKEFGVDYNRVALYLDMFLKQDWILNGAVKALGIRDEAERRKMVEALAEIYIFVASLYIRGEMGVGETIVFSVRELKRMAEDLQYAMARGKIGNKLLAEAVLPHLRDRWSSHNDRQKVQVEIGSLLESKGMSHDDRLLFNQGLGLAVSPSTEDFLTDQMIAKNRPVHLRVAPYMDVREELSRFTAVHPEAEVRVIPMTEETDRFMLEGGLAPTGDGRQAFADGLLGRLVLEARAHPDKQVVYVLENAHNLKPEVVVALNEILQDRKLYQKGRDTRQSLPANAHLLLVSRTDSDLSWSPAEQSRFVVRAVGLDLSGDPFENLSKILTARKVPDEIQQASILGITHAYVLHETEMGADPTRMGRISRRRLRRFVSVLATRVDAVPEGRLNSRIFQELIKQVFEEIILEDFPAAERSQRMEKYWPPSRKPLVWTEESAVPQVPSEGELLSQLLRMSALHPARLIQEDVEKILAIKSLSGWGWRKSPLWCLQPGDLGRGQLYHERSKRDINYGTVLFLVFVVSISFFLSGMVPMFWKIIFYIGLLIILIVFHVDFNMLWAVTFIVIDEDTVWDIKRKKSIPRDLLESDVKVLDEAAPQKAFFSDLKRVEAHLSQGRAIGIEVRTWIQQLLAQHPDEVQWESAQGTALGCGEIIRAEKRLLVNALASNPVPGNPPSPSGKGFVSPSLSRLGLQTKWLSFFDVWSLIYVWISALGFGLNQIKAEIKRFVLFIKTGNWTPRPVAPSVSQIIPLGLQTWVVGTQLNAVNLETGQEVSLSDLAHIERLKQDLPSNLPGLSSIAKPFVPFYGNKPFYFMEDAQGNVVLNFKGKIYPTRHKLLESTRESFEGFRPLPLSRLRNPHREDVAPLTERDFLMETHELERVEASALAAFSDTWHVDMEGPAGAGKTSIAQELALLLGLPKHVFQMHGERDLSDWIGNYRENSSGRIVLTNVPSVDSKGRRRYRQPLLDFLANGGVFVADEGAIGERGREMMSWLSSVVQGDNKIFLEEFPGHVTEIDVHPDFHLIITNNPAETTQGRQILKSEIAANVHFIHVEEDDSPEVLERLFLHFLGDNGPLTLRQKKQLAKIVVPFHSALKLRIGKDIGRDDPDRHFISKRELRRVAAQVQMYSQSHPTEDGLYALFGSLSIVYKAMFPHAEERFQISSMLQRAFSAQGVFLLDFTMLTKRREDEITGKFGGAATSIEAETAFMTNVLFDQDESVLYIGETGARTGETLRYVAQERGARVVPVDAAPEHTELEVLGDLSPLLSGTPAGGKRSHFVKGVITKHLLTRSEMAARAQGKPQETVVWIRNIDQWSEDIRTALNGFLEDGYLDLEVDEGRFVRYYKPPHVHFVAEITADTVQNFSSAFFNRWIKIGVSQDSPVVVPPNATSDFEEVLKKSYGLEANEIRYLSRIYTALLEVEEKRLWAGHGRYGLGSEIFYAVAEGIALAKREDPRWQGLLERIAQSGYDPRLHPAQGPPGDAVKRELWETTHQLTKEILVHELSRIVGIRFSPSTDQTTLSDRQRFESILKIVLNVEELPFSDPQLTFSPSDVSDRIGYTPLHPGSNARPPLAMTPAHQLRYTNTVVKTLDALARAATLGRAVAIAGETGAAKTTIAGHFAEMTGRRFYKYQTHAGSEQADLTMDLDQNEAGEFKKRVKEVYRLIREGQVVIDIDEANISPQILWALGPVIRGERWIHPIFPEEEPFEIGPDVLLVFTFNPVRYAGRAEIDPRLLAPMIQIWMEGPTETERAEIVETFYGVWAAPPAGAEGAASSEVELEKLSDSEIPTPPKEYPKGVAAEGSAGDPHQSGGIDRLMRKGEETFDETTKSPSPGSPSSTPKGQVKAYGVFDPELYPHTRYAAFNHYDEVNEHFVWGGENPTEIVPAPVLSKAQFENVSRELKKTHDLFDGRYRLNLSDSRWHVLPSAGAGMEMLDIQPFDGEGNRLDFPLEIGKDAAENWFVRAPGATGAVELRYRVAVPARYYGHRVSQGIPFHYAGRIPKEVLEAMGVIGLTGRERDFRDVLYRMIEFFRNFSLEENGISSTHGSLFLDLIHSQCGVCRHRAFAFARTALGIGMEVRYVTTDVHAFAEVRVPSVGWIRVDLGGGGDPANMDLSPLAHDRHSTRQEDDFPEPVSYRKNQEAFEKRMAQAMEQQGITPQRKERAGQGNKNKGTSDYSKDDQRIKNELKSLENEFVQDAEQHDQVSALLQKGLGQTEYIFHRMLKALQSRIRTVKKAMKAGLEVDPVAFMLKKPKQFVVRKKIPKMQNTAVGVLMDFSGSMGGMRDQLEFAVGAVGRNFWRLKEEAPQHFHYDFSYFKSSPTSVVKFGERISAQENDRRVLSMKGQIGVGGTEILDAMIAQRNSFMASREARGAKVKYVILFTDGADFRSISQGQFTKEMMDEMGKYREAGIDVIAVGIGQGAKDVRAFTGPGQHYVEIAESRPEDIAETIARVAEHKLLGSGYLPSGDVTTFLRIGGAPTAHAASVVASRTFEGWGLDAWTWIVKVMPRLETVFFAALSPGVVQLVLHMGVVSTLGVGLAAAGLAGVLFSAIHVLLLRWQGEKVSFKNSIAWFLVGFLFSLPLALVASGLITGTLPLLGIVMYFPAFHISLIPHEAINGAIWEERLKSVPVVGRPLAWLLEKPRSALTAAGQGIKSPTDPRAVALRLLSSVKTQSAGLGRMMRADVEVRYRFTDGAGIRYQHAFDGKPFLLRRGAPLRGLFGPSKTPATGRLDPSPTEGRRNPLNGQGTSSLLAATREDGPLSEQFLIAFNGLTDVRIGQETRNQLAARLRAMAVDPMGDREMLIAGVTFLHLAGGAMHPVERDLRTAQVKDINLVVQFLAIQGERDLGAIQNLFHQRADPIVKKVELILGLEAAGREQAEELGSDVVPVVSLVGLSKEEQVQAGVYIVGVAKALHEKGDHRTVLVPGAGADWRSIQKLNGRMIELRANIHPLNEAQSREVISYGKLDVKALVSYSKKTSLFPNKEHPSIAVVAKLENVDPFSVVAARGEGIDIETHDFISIIRLIGDEISHLAYVLLQA